MAEAAASLCPPTSGLYKAETGIWPRTRALLCSPFAGWSQALFWDVFSFVTMTTDIRWWIFCPCDECRKLFLLTFFQQLKPRSLPCDTHTHTHAHTHARVILPMLSAPSKSVLEQRNLSFQSSLSLSPSYHPPTTCACTQPLPAPLPLNATEPQIMVSFLWF